MSDTVRCLVCNREFRFLPSHLGRAHDLNAQAYRERFDLPASQPLAGDSYCEASRQRMNGLIATGQLNHDHLPAAVDKARTVGRRPLRGQARERVRAAVLDTAPWQASTLPAGSKRADGRDADRAREYQREYRARKKQPKRDTP